MADPSAPALVEVASRALVRIGRSADPLRFSRLDPIDALSSSSGNRFDVPGGGVLYASTELRTCFEETLARFRPSTGILARMQREDASFMVVGGVPGDWRAQRSIVRFELIDPLPFVDADAIRTHQALQRELATELAALDVPDLDLGTVRGRDRRVTRLIAAWAYGASDDEGPLYGGIRYESRIAGGECFAIFDGTAIAERERQPIRLEDPELQAVADAFGLRPF
ncbi:RES family NAD+ phosphorylase [Agrococcus sp. Marseille-Q4369]|uniref:RES family NAD+ phosphorylase n=1 Tax=Agrococcus sp. Marseille-Q4369 TaxID=2810513 RepID=UPI001B8D7289|nr:RES family NAD+ phosphorylase [Agrococcus sp. Marseille-Q4369]QUW19814.1 RES family NAD+ phosphorylase [Agrococcus sp. Marseille-Q4369]